VANGTRPGAPDPAPERRSLRVGTTAHYSNAEYYDRAYRRHVVDLGFYLQTALEHGGPVLELGCGTGRVTFYLARAGLDVVGVDSSAEMLRAARDKAAALPADVGRRVELVEGDVRDLRLGRSFRLVVAPFNVLQHLYSLDDFERGLDTVRRHLEPDRGRLAFDVLLPDLRGLARDPTRRYRLGRVYHPAGRKRYDYRESFDYDAIAQVEHITLWFDDPDDPSASFATPLAHRQFFPQELDALLHYNGFAVVERWGSFDRDPLDDDAESQIYVCRLAARPRPR
jgi:SAM-dependent methyltransferase